MKRLFGLVCAVAAFGAFVAPARAVDRSLGADVPKPAVTGAPWTDAEIAALGANLDVQLAGADALRGAHAALYAIDARDGRVLYQRNADDAFQPASTLKLLVGSAALDKLGPGFRFRTEATIENTVVDGVLRGYLMLRGSGDVLLNDADLAGLPGALRAVAIREIEQDVAVDFSDQPEYLPGWSWDDFPWYYAAPVSALGFADDRVTVTVTAGARAGDPVRTAVEPWGRTYGDAGSCDARELSFCIVVQARTGAPGSGSSLDAVRGTGAYAFAVTITGTIASDAKPEHLSLAAPNPPRFAAAAARRALVAAGIPVRGRGVIVELRRSDDQARRRVVWSHDSEPLSDLLADLWEPSDNMLAETLLRALGAQPPARTGTSAQGIAYEKTWLRGLGIATESLALEDGSGLSAYDRVTPRALVTILKHDWDGPYRDLVLDDLPVAGVRGTLKSSFAGTPAEKRVFAKTGSLSHVSSLAGYVANAKHGAVIFAFPVDDFVGDAAALRALRARVLSELAER
ncbi:MAG TPA: D-alanyl-D-alanine carboxypeptidase/D-alanyl-D-alanine-endopeptidase [Candidatus Elarobacter sp.]|nr:D-alanyl-D-alanine carboxypeptidase/D-alanyl-D-alanine-endopeptidase [Candidatus Elarobacter sp.]